MYLAAEITLALQINGWPQHQVARALGISPQAVSQAIRGTSPSRRTSLFIAQILTEPPAADVYPGMAAQLFNPIDTISQPEPQTNTGCA